MFVYSTIGGQCVFILHRSQKISKHSRFLLFWHLRRIEFMKHKTPNDNHSHFDCVRGTYVCEKISEQVVSLKNNRCVRLHTAHHKKVITRQSKREERKMRRRKKNKPAYTQTREIREETDR